MTPTYDGPLAGIPTDEETVRSLDRAHVFHSWSAQALIDPLPIQSASGSRFTDYSGRSYLDFSSQLVNVNIGYQHPKLVRAIADYAQQMTTIQPSFANDARSEAARLIAEVAPGDLSRVFFTNGGAEATENALRMARLHTGRHKVLAAYRSYHGATAGSISMTGDPRRWPNEPLLSGVVHYFGPYLYRSAFHATTEEEECERALAHLRDLITFAKGVNSGYVPLGGVLINDAINETFQQRVYPGGLTYSGHPLACASAVASIEIFKEEGIVEHARTMGDDVIGPELEKLAARHPSIGEVRGLGMFWALELVRDRDTHEPLVPFNAGGADAKPMVDLANACKERGLWPFTHFNRLHVVPPCTTTADELREGLAALDEALDVADEHHTGR